jgi:DNA sulfur modification protein DndD
VIFQELILENFGCYCGKQVLDLNSNQSSDESTIILIGGMNGGGKTTLMDGLRLALYGHRAQCPTRGRMSYGDFLSQYINRQSNAPVRIELAFKHIIGRSESEIRIRRTWTFGHKDSLKVFVDGCENNETARILTKTWDEWIEDIFPLGISNLFLFDGEQIKELGEQDIPPQPLISAMRSLLGLELADRLLIDLETLITKKRKEIAGSKELAQFEDLEQQLEVKQQELSNLKKLTASLQQKLDQAEEKARLSEATFFNEGGKIASEHHQIDTELKNLEQSLELHRKSLKDLASILLPLSTIAPLLERASILGKEELRQQGSGVPEGYLEERDRRLIEFIKSLKVPVKSFEEIKKFLTAEQLFTTNSNRKILDMESEILSQLDSILRYSLPEQLKKARLDIEAITEIEIQTQYFERLQTTAAPEVKYEKLKANLQQAQEQVSKLTNERNNLLATQDQLMKVIATAKEEIIKYGEEAIDRQSKEHFLRSAAKAQQTLRVFQEQLLLRKLNQLESKITECFVYLLHKSNLVHRIAIESHSFKLSLYDHEGKEIPKNRLSAGEKQLLATAFLWGLARVSGRELPVAIDTPLGRLDSEHRANLVDRYFPSASHQVILLSTDTEIGQKEVSHLRQQGSIAHEYLLKQDSSTNCTTIQQGYFWVDN